MAKPTDEELEEAGVERTKPEPVKPQSPPQGPAPTPPPPPK
jgi:hypothetical protein